MIRARTTAHAISVVGTGLHTGRSIRLTMRPAPAKTGLIFRRTDMDNQEIPALAKNVTETMLCTTLSNGTAQVSTVEHILAAAAGLGIDDLYFDIDGPEVPIMDGSAGPFVFLLQSAGIREQATAKRFIRIKRKISVKQDDKEATLEPYNGFKVNFTIDFAHPVFHSKNQTATLDFSSTAFVKEVSRARTFGFLSQLEELRDKKLILGGSMDNAIVLDDFRVLNEDGLRDDKELVNHKIVDVIGDLYLLGAPVLGAYTGFKSGHALNNLLLRSLLAEENSDAWEYVTFEDNTKKSPIAYFKPLLTADYTLTNPPAESAG